MRVSNDSLEKNQWNVRRSQTSVSDSFWNKTNSKSIPIGKGWSSSALFLQYLFLAPCTIPALGVLMATGLSLCYLGRHLQPCLDPCFRKAILCMLTSGPWRPACSCLWTSLLGFKLTCWTPSEMHFVCHCGWGQGTAQQQGVQLSPQQLCKPT